ncbi:hypothetical protein P171DRAFT_440179 [Karstenula rhodostoma CBS 690.94]|uniref:Uncharacterized protein n=1 Tax=Karstenula rhodostoma CBS 690.94 TaxID=1392251 RepID=A0A9P4PR10_9PLEO|nr:hypothetical protein P171DRAFT_440179 [Karstenula rhodostoma CBS 690.94]
MDPLFYEKLPKIRYGLESGRCKDNIGRRGLSRKEPLQLLNPFLLKMGKVIWIRSEFPVHLVPLETRSIDFASTIGCPTAICIQPRETYWLVPQCPLREGFKEGWEKLAQELRDMILACNLAVGGVDQSNDYATAQNNYDLAFQRYAILRERYRIGPPKFIWPKNHLLLKQHRALYHSAAASQAADKVFYEVNEIRLHPRPPDRFPFSYHLRLPNASTRHWIRRLVYSFYTTPEAYASLQPLARKENGFTGLAFVSVKIHRWRPNIDYAGSTALMRMSENEANRMLEEKLPGNAKFECDGVLTFPMWGVFYDNSNSLAEVVLQDIMRRKITFNNKVDAVTETGDR